MTVRALALPQPFLHFMGTTAPVAKIAAVAHDFSESDTLICREPRELVWAFQLT